MSGRHYFAAWSTEYPEEGSLLFLAKDARAARKKARNHPWFEGMEINVARMTRKLIMARRERRFCTELKLSGILGGAP